MIRAMTFPATSRAVIVAGLLKCVSMAVTRLAGVLSVVADHDGRAGFDPGVGSKSRHCERNASACQHARGDAGKGERRVVDDCRGRAVWARSSSAPTTAETAQMCRPSLGQQHWIGDPPLQ